jgi:hypothetical protein
MSEEQTQALVALQEALAGLTRRVDGLEAQLQALDASYVRHQGQTETDLDRMREQLRDREQDVWRLEDELRRRGEGR